MISSASPTVENLVTDTWIKASWEDFLLLTENPNYASSKFYYEQEYMRIEMLPIGSIHSQDNSIISKVISLYATVKRIRIKELTNASFRKSGIAECQPDIAFYIGEEFQFPPRSNSPINLDEFNPPTLVIELGATYLSDDLGRKRLLYERLGVQEYWVVDVNAGDVIAFEIADGKSGEIQESVVLAGLAIALVEEALQRGENEDDGAINRWLLETFSQS